MLATKSAFNIPVGSDEPQNIARPRGWQAMELERVRRVAVGHLALKVGRHYTHTCQSESVAGSRPGLPYS
jgi:hypothetical protein